MVTPDNSPPPLPPPPLPQQQRATTAVDGNGSRTKTSPPAARNALPDRNVDGDSLEDAYVSFIYYCNPALPADADVAALREAFRNPPKSGGKSFSSFAIYQLVRQFYQKEIKTWTDLTIKLGVEPPDPTRDESAQKITQYGVRLKKWMNSLHVRSFFEYLMDIPNEYWTQIPDGPDPTAVHVRDGVALEDDMALRALLPHIRPKRGRKRPGENDNTSSPGRLRRASPMSAIDEHRQQGSTIPWPNMPDHHVPYPRDAPRSAHPSLGPNDGSQTPFSGWPNSAITPSTRTSFWDDAMEPRSAVTPSGSKPGRQRRGAKNVSSAWRPGGTTNGGKARGRPPIARTPVEGPGFSFRSAPSSAPIPPPLASPPEPNISVLAVNPYSRPSEHAFARTAPTPPTPVAPIPIDQGQPPIETKRPARPSISLQVPQRAGGTVRLATPPHQTPPLVMINGEQRSNGPSVSLPTMDTGPSPSIGWWKLAEETRQQYEDGTYRAPEDGRSKNPQVDEYYFERMEDRTNVDGLMAYWMRVLHQAEWFDAEGNPAETGPMDEVAAIVNSTLQTMAENATSSQGFLINLAALAGAKSLMNTRQKCFRLHYDQTHNYYRFEWDYRFGHIQGTFDMATSVPRSMYERPGAVRHDGPGAASGVGLSTQEWQNKYSSLLGEVEKRERELAELRARMTVSDNEDA